MTTWNESYHCLNRPGIIEARGAAACVFFPVAMLMMITLCPGMLYAFSGTTGYTAEVNPMPGFNAHADISQSFVANPVRIRYTRSDHSFRDGFPHFYTGLKKQRSVFSHRMTLQDDSEPSRRDTVPKPSSVMRKSMILPGWGQVVNRQIWKVPIIYGMLAGLTYYSIQMDQNYRDYRAAFYNSQNPDGDQRFGPTPPHIDPNQSPDAMRYNRNVYRNRRDLSIIGIVLAYGLNIVDAYVFAHMRDFDVSDDLSAGFQLGPAYFPGRETDHAMFVQGSNSGGYMFSASNSMDGLVLTLKIALR